ncbi:glycosyltransferase [Thermomonas sp.]
MTAQPSQATSTPMETTSPALAPDRTLRRVVYVVSQFPCLSETFIVREIEGLLARGVDVRILSLKHSSGDSLPVGSEALLARSWHPGPIVRGMARIAQVVMRHPFEIAKAIVAIATDGWRHPLSVFKSLAALCRGLEQVDALREFAPQLIHAHWATYPATVAWVLGRILRTPFGFTCHAHDIFVEQQLLARKIEDAGLAVTISRYNVEWLAHHVTPVAKTKLRIVHCGVDLARYELRPEGRATAEILAVGRLDPIKGFETLVEAVARLRARGIEVHARIIGAGPLEARLRALAGRRGIADRIRFDGAQPQEVVRAAMDKASVFVLPSQVANDGNRDGIPVALMEAMASGCPVVSTRVSGIPELIGDAVDGLLVEPRDSAALADAMQRLLHDRELRGHLTTNARARIEAEFDAHQQAGRMHDYMAGAIHDR